MAIEFLRFIDELQGQIDSLKKKIGNGGGTSVDITPTLESGVKLADFSIDGESGAIFAPASLQPLASSTWQIGTLENDPVMVSFFQTGALADGQVTIDVSSLGIKKMLSFSGAFYDSDAFSYPIQANSSGGKSYNLILRANRTQLLKQGSPAASSTIMLVYTINAPAKTVKSKKKKED